MSTESFSWPVRLRSLISKRLTPLLSRWPFDDKSVRAALFAFTLTRALVFLIFIFVVNIKTNDVAVSFGAGEQHPYVTLEKSSVAQSLRPLARRADGGWNIAVAEEGYEHAPFEASAQHNWAIFPLYPLLVRFIARLTRDYELTAIALSNLCFLLALILLHKTVLAFGFEPSVADCTLFYLAVFPTSYFFSVAQTESLFLLLTAASFYAAARESWWTAGIFGALASATRFSGILLLPALLLLYWQRHRFRLRANLLGVLLVPFGLLSFMYYLWRITGNAFAFKDVQAAWGRSATFFFQPIFNYAINDREIASPWDFRLLNFSMALLAFICAYALARRREWALAFYTLASVVIPLSSQSWMGMTRYMMVVFPISLMLAVRGQSSRMERVISTAFIALFSLMTIFFAAQFSFAMT